MKVKKLSELDTLDFLEQLTQAELIMVVREQSKALKETREDSDELKKKMLRLILDED